MTIRFICRAKPQTERQTIAETAQRIAWCWLPFSFASTKARAKGERVVTIRPLVSYMLCQGSHAEYLHVMEHKNVYGPVWFVSERQWSPLMRWRGDVEAAFNANLDAFLEDAPAFHCQYNPGQEVTLRQRGRELLPATFKGIAEDGAYIVETEFFGSKREIRANPRHVTA